MAKGNDFTRNPGGPSTGSGKGNDFTRNPGGPSTSGIPAKARMPAGEKPAAPDPDIPIPEGGRMPFKPPVFSKADMGNRMAQTPPGTTAIVQGPKPYKGLKD